MARQANPPSGEMFITPTGNTRVSLWRARAIAFLRIAFGVIWGIDAWLKWQPAFINSFSDQVTGAAQDQPAWVQAWINFWGHIVGSNPYFFAYLTASVDVVHIFPEKNSLHLQALML